MSRRLEVLGRSHRSGVARAAAVLDVLTAGVLSVGADGTVRSANEGAARVLRHAEGLVGRDVAELVAPLEVLRLIAEGGAPRSLVVRRGDGAFVDLEVHVGTYAEDEDEGAGAVTTVMLHDRALVPARACLHSARRTAVDVLVAETCARLAAVAEQRGVRLAWVGGELPPLRLDRDVLRCVVLHLVTNAVEACREGARVTVDARVVGRTFELEVRDTGDGMTPEVQARCMDLFYSRRKGSAGIGLALCRRIAESSRGEIAVSSRYGLGTEVLVRIPLEGDLQLQAIFVQPACPPTQLQVLQSSVHDSPSW